MFLVNSTKVVFDAAESMEGLGAVQLPSGLKKTTR